MLSPDLARGYPYPFRLVFAAHTIHLGGPLYRDRESAMAVLRDFCAISMSTDHPSRFMVEDHAGQVFAFTVESCSHVILEETPSAEFLLAEYKEFRRVSQEMANEKFGVRAVGFKK